MWQHCTVLLARDRNFSHNYKVKTEDFGRKRSLHGSRQPDCLHILLLTQILHPAACKPNYRPNSERELLNELKKKLSGMNQSGRWYVDTPKTEETKCTDKVFILCLWRTGFSSRSGHPISSLKFVIQALQKNTQIEHLVKTRPVPSRFFPVCYSLTVLHLTLCR